MTRSLASYLVLAVILDASWARADGARDKIFDDLTKLEFDPATCLAAPPAPAATGALAAPPVTWNDFELFGDLRDPAATVRALYEPTMNRHRALTDTARDDLRRISTAFGYYLVGLGTRETSTGTHAVVHLSPLPMVRKIAVDVDQSLFDVLLDEEIRRRMRVRAGSYLPWTPKERACDLYEEKLRIEEYLRDEGYFEARVAIGQKRHDAGIELKINVDLGAEYTTKTPVPIALREPDTVDDAVIRDLFRNKKCIVANRLCYASRFTRAEHQKAIQAVVDEYHRKGYPAVRVRTDYDPMTSFDRKTKKVRFTVTIDTRRELAVKFEGYDPDVIPKNKLLAQLTFNQAASSDDVEASESAKALTALLQSRGFFDARVTWTRERFDKLDHIVYRIEAGKIRQVRSIEFKGNYALTDDDLSDVIGTREAKLSTSLFGRSTAATSAQLAADVDAIVAAYRRAGYRDARVSVSAATEPAGLGDAALTAALALSNHGTGLYVRYTIDEGQPTLMTQVEVQVGRDDDKLVTADQRALCTVVLADLATFYDEPQLATPAAPDRCVAVAAGLKFRESDAGDTRDRIRDLLFSHGRPRAKVTYEPRPLGTRRVAAHYKLADIQLLSLGKVVVRGNFKTREFIIRGELDEAQLREGQPLTKDRLAEAARRLRNTSLFDAVNVAMPDLDNASEGALNAFIEVTERYDYNAQLDLEGGYSSYNKAFLKAIPGLKNMFGRGISLETAVTVGFDAVEFFESQDVRLSQLSVEAALRFPAFFIRNLIGREINTELSAFRRIQDTPRFGELTTDGASLAGSWTKQWPPQGTAPPRRALTIGGHYDFRRRQRPVDVLRPAGADDDDAQVPITTRTGSIGASIELEQRVDRNGTLSPLSPQGGFRFEGQASIAAPWLGGQDTFIKVSASGTKYWAVGPNLVFRADLRYDQGFPLGGAVLLPEVERYFAGGDSTVRGYEDDRLATEIVQVGVPPLDNLQQIRIMSAGGNIRVMSSVDAQLRIWKVLSAGLFADAGLITNQWSTVREEDIRPSVGIALLRIVTPFGTGALERAIPLKPELGDNPRGRWHVSFAARAQF